MGSEQLGVAHETGFDRKPTVVTLEMAAEILVNLGALGSRSKEDHVALEDVDELWQLVEPAVAEEAATGEHDPMVEGDQVGPEHSGCTTLQRAELVHGEGVLVAPETLALVEDWPPVDCEDQKRNADEKW